MPFGWLAGAAGDLLGSLFEGGGSNNPGGNPTYQGQYMGSADNTYMNALTRMNDNGLTAQQQLLPAYQQSFNNANTIDYSNYLNKMGGVGNIANNLQNRSINSMNDMFNNAATANNRSNQLYDQGFNALNAMTSYAPRLQRIANTAEGRANSLFDQGQSYADTINSYAPKYQATANSMGNRAINLYNKGNQLYDQGQANATNFADMAGVAKQQEQNLYGLGDQIYQTAFDPQQQLYDRTANKVVDQSRAAQAVRGLGNSAYGAGLENDAMNNFNIDWQNQQLNRQLSGAQGITNTNAAGANQANLQSNNWQNVLNSQIAGGQANANLYGQAGNQVGLQYQGNQLAQNSPVTAAGVIGNLNNASATQSGIGGQAIDSATNNIVNGNRLLSTLNQGSVAQNQLYGANTAAGYGYGDAAMNYGQQAGTIPLQSQQYVAGQPAANANAFYGGIANLNNLAGSQGNLANSYMTGGQGAQQFNASMNANQNAANANLITQGVKGAIDSYNTPGSWLSNLFGGTGGNNAGSNISDYTGSAWTNWVNG